MTKLSVNINKIATIRNARGGNNPDVVRAALDIESFGADGITVHPRPDERHIRRSDVIDLKQVLSTEFNIEGNPDQRFMELVLRVRPTQVTLVPDAPDALTSSAGGTLRLTLSISPISSRNLRTRVSVPPFLSIPMSRWSSMPPRRVLTESNSTQSPMRRPIPLTRK